MAPRAPGSVRRVLKRVFYCPASGAKIKNETIKPHTLPLQVCVNGTLFGHCTEHDIRIFVRSSPFIRKIMATEIAFPEKERPHGP